MQSQHLEGWNRGIKNSGPSSNVVNPFGRWLPVDPVAFEHIAKYLCPWSLQSAPAIHPAFGSTVTEAAQHAATDWPPLDVMLLSNSRGMSSKHITTDLLPTMVHRQEWVEKRKTEVLGMHVWDLLVLNSLEGRVRSLADMSTVLWWATKIII